MDAAGIDVQVLSIAPPGIHNLPTDVAVDAAKMTNDYLAKKISENPKDLEPLHHCQCKTQKRQRKSSRDP